MSSFHKQLVLNQWLLGFFMGGGAGTAEEKSKDALPMSTCETSMLHKNSSSQLTSEERRRALQTHPAPEQLNGFKRTHSLSKGMFR